MKVKFYGIDGEKMEQYFDKIIIHLNRKNPVETMLIRHNDTEWKFTKPIIEISDDGKSLWCYYAHHYMYVFYNEKKSYNPYEISIESQCVFKKYQTIGIRYYSDVAPTQEDVIECIRYRLRK